MAVLSVVIPLVLIFSLCWAFYNPNENINAYLFDAQKFEFIDLSQSANKNEHYDLFKESYG